MTATSTIDAPPRPPAEVAGSGRPPGRPGAGALVAAIVLGFGLAIAPMIFAMFERAPKGGRMIDEFRPFMTQTKIDAFRGHLDTIGKAAGESRARGLGKTHDAVGKFEDEFPSIDADMRDMLDTMEKNVANFRGVDALPPFPMFPWFFVLPGLMAAAIATLAFRASGTRRRGLSIALGVLGVGLIAAPAVFGMFTRAPGGARMIADFKALMTPEKVTRVQGYFLTIGAGEGQLRTEAAPEADKGIGELYERWPAISAEMAPMVGTMSDNLVNYAAVAALPPFALFPWFFVAPGVMLIGCGAIASRRSS